MQELESHYARLEQQNPTMLIAPASVLKMLAHAVWSGKLRMCPRKIIAVAEVLEPFDRDYIASIFHSTVHQVYQCTEGFLGVTCEHGTLHLNESRVLIEKEVIDADNHRFVPIITDFSRFTQPFVRYRLNDVLRERTTPCPCGSAELAIEAIEGRCDDVLYLQSATQTTAIRPIFADFIRRAIMQVDLPIDEYAVEQTAIDRLQIHILCDESLFAQINVQLQLQFEGLFQQLGVQMPTVTIDNKFSLPARGDKLRRIRRTFEWEGAL
jgi:putative adenylate-forming enzyme